MSVRIVVASLKGGTGKTTVAANLAAQLTRAGRRCMAFDLDPQNALGLHFGLPPGSGPGIVTEQLSARAVADHLRRIRATVAFLPFGQHSPEQRARVEAWLDAAPEWLPSRLDALSPPRCEVVVLDTPAAYSPWSRHALASADLVLAVLLADAASYATVPAFEEYAHNVAGVAPERIHYLFNQFNPNRSLSRDVVDALRALIPNRVLPFEINDDEFTREQLANAKPVVDGTISQTAADFDQLAQWVLQRVAGEGSTTTLDSPDARPARIASLG
jgi:cellulose synthase operon protein YhjQ